MTWKEIKDKAEEIGVKDDTKVFFTNYTFGGRGEEFEANFKLENNELLINNPGGCDCGFDS